MAKYGKWIGGGLGWALGGPIGALLGFAIGSMIDQTRVEISSQSGGAGSFRNTARHHTTASDFTMSLLVLSAAVMKADGKVLKSELEYVKTFLLQQFPASEVQQLLPVLRDVLQKDIHVREVCAQIRYNMEHPLRLQLLHYLFGIARADGTVSEKEAYLIEQISAYLGINPKDFASIRAMFYKDTNSAYKILEIEPGASDADVKKAYRKMAVKYHPDKLNHLGEEFKKAATEKFQKVQEAYETIKKERGMK
jgi:DnaJ like chaperone protein